MKLKLRRHLFRQRKFRQLLLALSIVSIFLGVLVVSVEKNEGNIQTVPQGLWWAATTVTAVGYGDFYPVTGPGWVIGVSLQVIGVIIFGVLVAYISISMNRKVDRYYWDKVFQKLDDLEKKTEQLSQHSQYLIQEKEE